MSFEQKTWINRSVQYAGRVTLTNVDTEEVATYDMARAEGEVYTDGDALSAANLNDLEERIAAAIDAAGTSSGTSSDSSSGTAATITVGTTTTGDAGTEASVTNSGTDTDVILDFVIPRGADGTDGADGAAGADGADGTGIAFMTQTASSTESGGTNTWAATMTDGTVYSFDVLNGAQGETGATGATGETGAAGAAGADGADGASAYDYAVDGGYTGTETEFAALMATIVALIDAEEASY